MARRRPTPFLTEARGTGWRQKVALEGTEQLAARVRALDREVSGAALILALDKGTEVLENVMGQLAPVDEGDLSRGIGREMTRLGSKRVQMAVAPKKEVWYGTLQELGTSDMPAQPFMRPALDATRDRIADVFAQELRAAVGRVTSGA